MLKPHSLAQLLRFIVPRWTATLKDIHAPAGCRRVQLPHA